MTWHRIKTFILFVVLPLTLSCEGCVRQQYSVTGTFPLSRTFTIDETGSFQGGDLITADDIRDALDIPQDACITSVDIQGISLKYKLLPDNAATSVTVSGFVEEIGGTGRTFAFEDYLLPMPVGYVQQAIVTGLLATGISAIQERIEGFLTGLGSQAFVVGVVGDASPAGSRVNIDLTLTIRGSFQYAFCIDVFDFMAEGPECTLPENLPDECPDIGSP
jgi:hypothetical protein